MGPSGPQGPAAPEGTSGPLGITGNTGPTGNIGSTGSGISASVGLSGCAFTVLQSKDGSTFTLGSMTGNKGVTTDTPSHIMTNVGTGANLFIGVSGATAYFRTFRSSGDITISESLETLTITAPAGSGQASQVVGPTGSLLYYAGTTFLRGADDTFFVEGTEPQENSVQMVFDNFQEIVKRHDPAANANVSVSLKEANNHYVVGSTNYKINNVITNTNGFTALNSDGVTFGESMNITFILKNAGLASSENPFVDSKFKFVPAGPTFSTSGTDIVNCISFDNGNEWHCFIAGKNYGTTFDGILRIGSCCDGESPPNCTDYVFKTDCEGTFTENVTCNSEPCAAIFGACCVNQSCFRMSDTKCEFLAGRFFPNQSCDTFSCPAPCENLGCCCLGAGGKITASAQICADLGGLYNGDDTCEGFDQSGIDPCEELTRGACCLSSECRSRQTPQECRDIGGVHMGPLTECESVDCCSGQAIPLGACCCSDGSCSDNITQSLCTGANCVWTQGSGCEVCGTVLNCNCTQEGDNIPLGFRKWKLWIKDIYNTVITTPDLKLLGQSVTVDHISGPTGCDRLSDGKHNTYYEAYGNVLHDSETEAIPYAHELSNGLPTETQYYVPSVNEMSFIALQDKNNFKILLGDTFPNVPYWTSTRKSSNRFYTVNEDGYAVDYNMSNEGAVDVDKRVVIVQREMIPTGGDAGIDIIGSYDEGNGRTFAGVFSAGCSLVVSNYKNNIWDLPTYACSDPVETGICCTNFTCSITNEYNCTENGGIYHGDEVEPVCGNLCEAPPEQVQTHNCVRAGASPSFASNEDSCASGLPNQMYYYAGDVRLDGTPVVLSTYDLRNYTDENYNIEVSHVAAGGDLTQGYCVGHNEAFTCTTDRNILSPTAIGSPTLLAYCNSDEIYGTGYSCPPSVCGEVSSNYDRIIDDCLSANSTALCGKSLGPSVVQFLNTQEDTTCSTINWPIDNTDKFPCGDNSAECNSRIKLFDGSIDNSWVQSTDEITTVFACESCLNSFCAYVTNIDVTHVSCCKPDGTWSETCASLYNSYLQSVYYNECDDENPFCGNAVEWSSIVAPTPEIGTYSDIDKQNFNASSVECKSRIQALRQSSSLDPNCSDINGTPAFRKLNYVDFSVKQKHAKLVDDELGIRDVPVGLEFKFLPVICGSVTPCIAGQTDKFTDFSPSRYTSLLYGIDLGTNTNQSLIGNTENNLGLCYDSSCEDTTISAEDGDDLTRINTILGLNAVNENRNKQSGLLITNCQNRIYCKDTDENGCSVCGTTEDLVETPTPLDFGCWDCTTGECETRNVCEGNEIYTSSCTENNPCPLGRCCYPEGSEPRCEESVSWVDCKVDSPTADENVWTQDGECTLNACTCQDKPFGNCCTNGVLSYTCDDACEGSWVEGPEDSTIICEQEGCCYILTNNASTRTSIETDAECPSVGSIVILPTPGDPEESTVIYRKWTIGTEGGCPTPTGRRCLNPNPCDVVDVASNFGVTIQLGGGIIAMESEDIFLPDGDCINNPCLDVGTPCCCTGILAEGDVRDDPSALGEVQCEQDVNEFDCIPSSANVVGSTQLTLARTENGFCPEVCELPNPQGDFGYCCYSPDDSGETRLCKWPVGQWYCINQLHQDPNSEASWGTAVSICNNCAAPEELIKCCYTTLFNQRKCRYVSQGDCNESFLVTDLTTCGQANEFGIDNTVPPASSGSVTESEERVRCGLCLPEDDDCCFCAPPTAQLNSYVCDSGNNNTICPTENTSIVLELTNIVPSSPPDCVPELKIFLCEGSVGNTDGCVDKTDQFFPGGFGLDANGRTPSIRLRDLGLQAGSDYYFLIQLSNCAGVFEQPVTTSSFSFTSSQTCLEGGGPGLPGGMESGSNACLIVF